MQNRKGIFMLHHKGFIGFLNAFGNQAAFNIPAIDKVVFKIPVSPGNQGLADKAEFKATVMYVDGMGVAEISSALGKSQKSVSNALARAKQKLIKLYS